VNVLIDTCLLSELSRARPDGRVLAWFGRIPEESLHISVLTLGEIRRGAEEHPDPRRRERLRRWVDTEVAERFGARMLVVDIEVADRWGRLLAEVGRPVAAVDGLLAATALAHGLTLATRNESDFRFPGLEVINPWKT
jgi:hypothetical protein